MIRYYLAPYEPVSFGGRTPSATRCLNYLIGEPYRQWSVRGNPQKNWCLCMVDTSLALHSTIQADAQITLIPFLDNESEYLSLGSTISQINSISRDNISNFLEARRVPTDWILGTHTIRQVLNFVVRYFLIVQKLKNDYPEFDLSDTVADIPTAQKNRIMTWMDDNNIDRSDILLSTLIRDIIQIMINRYGWRNVYAKVVS